MDPCPPLSYLHLRHLSYAFSRLALKSYIIGFCNSAELTDSKLTSTKLLAYLRSLTKIITQQDENAKISFERCVLLSLNDDPSELTRLRS